MVSFLPSPCDSLRLALVVASLSPSVSSRSPPPACISLRCYTLAPMYCSQLPLSSHMVFSTHPRSYIFCCFALRFGRHIASCTHILARSPAILIHIDCSANQTCLYGSFGTQTRLGEMKEKSKIFANVVFTCPRCSDVQRYHDARLGWQSHRHVRAWKGEYGRKGEVMKLSVENGRKAWQQREAVVGLGV